MKNYIISILILVGLGFLTSPLVTNAKADISPDFATEAEESEEDIVFENKENIAKADVAEIATSAKISTPVTTARATKASNATSGSINYTITNHPNAITSDPGNYINKVGKLVYAHNDANLMFSALSLKSGSTFTITDSGVAKTYRVTRTQIISKAELAAVVPGKNYNLMWKVAYYPENSDIVLMTCYERTRNAPNRYLVYAVEI